jgi:phospholipid transport system substrate-binding protein
MSEPRRRRWIPLAIGSGLLLGAAANAAEPAAPPKGPRPRQIIEHTAQEVLVILRATERSHEERVAALDQIARERFDFRTMCRLVLARNWKKLSEQQQVDFVEAFTQYLANDYGSRLDRYEQEDVTVLGERTEPRGDVTVKTKISGGKAEGAIVDYRLRYRKDEWRIIDVVIEGISMIANFRDQFREVLAREGPDRLLEKLREKNAARNAAESSVAAPTESLEATPLSFTTSLE